MLKLLVNMVSDAIAKKFKLNELVKQIKQSQKNVSKFGKYIEEVEKDIAEIKSKIIAEEKTREAAKKNTNFRKFLDNMESRIYAEFSKQLTDAMFGEACGTSYTAEGATVAPTAEVMENGASTTNDTQTLSAGAGGGTSCNGTMTFNGTTMTYTKDLANDQVVLQIDGPDCNETITFPLNDFQF